MKVSLKQLADVVLPFGATIPLMMFGVVFWGLHMGFTQGLLATVVADSAPVELRGTAFGMFNLVTGAVLLIASVPLEIKTPCPRGVPRC